MEEFFGTVATFLALAGTYFVGKKIYAAYDEYLPGPAELYYNAFARPFSSYMSVYEVEKMLKRIHGQLKWDYKQYKKEGGTPYEYYPFKVLYARGDGQYIPPSDRYRLPEGACLERKLCHQAWATCEIIERLDGRRNNSFLVEDRETSKILNEIMEREMQCLASWIDDPDFPHELLFYDDNLFLRKQKYAPEAIKQKYPKYFED